MNRTKKSKNTTRYVNKGGSNSSTKRKSSNLTKSHSRIYDSIKKKWVFTNKLGRQEEKQNKEIDKRKEIKAQLIKDIPNYFNNKYVPNQFVGLQTAHQTRGTKPTIPAFRGTKYRRVFDQFNKHRT